ncbi:hypothetical protein CR513_45452, partial [Mucuna pruriens]
LYQHAGQGMRQQFKPLIISDYKQFKNMSIDVVANYLENLISNLNDYRENYFIFVLNSNNKKKNGSEMNMELKFL